MGKLEQFISGYVDNSGLLIEQDPLAAPPPVDPAMAAPPVDPAAAGGQAPETKTLTDAGYVNAVRDMLELLSISPKDLSENDLEIFSDNITPKNASAVHDDLRDMIEMYGSPNA